MMRRCCVLTVWFLDSVVRLRLGEGEGEGMIEGVGRGLGKRVRDERGDKDENRE